MTKVIQRVINKNVETKQAFTLMAPTSFNAGISGTGDVLALIPGISNGSFDNQRIGDQIQAKSMKIQGAVVWNPSAAIFGSYNSARIAVRIMIVQPKAYNNQSDVTSFSSTWMPTLLKRGGTTVAFTGTLNDLWTPINTDAITKYYDRIYYLNGYYNTGPSNVQLIGSTRQFTARLKFRGAGKRFRYDANFSSGILPTNFAPVMIIGYANMNGTGPDTVSTAITVQYDSTLLYKDA